MVPRYEQRQKQNKAQSLLQVLCLRQFSLLPRDECLGERSMHFLGNEINALNFWLSWEGEKSAREEKIAQPHLEIPLRSVRETSIWWKADLPWHPAHRLNMSPCSLPNLKSYSHHFCPMSESLEDGTSRHSWITLSVMMPASFWTWGSTYISVQILPWVSWFHSVAEMKCSDQQNTGGKGWFGLHYQDTVHHWGKSRQELGESNHGGTGCWLTFLHSLKPPA